jgi:LmbE family N-acetylglucosaminyl deacetylase
MAKIRGARTSKPASSKGKVTSGDARNKALSRWFVGLKAGKDLPPAPSLDFYEQLIAAVRKNAPELPHVPSLPATSSESFEGPVKVVAYVAHPDDESGYSGGLLRKLTRGGHEVNTVILSNGEGGRVVERGPDGKPFDNRSYSPEQLVKIRHREVRNASKVLKAPATFLYPAKPAVDFGYTTSTPETLKRWDEELPGGLEGIIRSLVADIRRRKPDVIVTLMQDDTSPRFEEHGHHKAMGLLVDLAARLAGDPAFGRGKPHVVREVLSASGRSPDAIEIPVDKEDRRAAMKKYPSQFLEEMLHGGSWEAPFERFRLIWRVQGSHPSEGGSLLNRP